MKKKLSKSLMTVNIVIVLLLLVNSVVMIFIANTQQKNIFSYQAKLVIGEKLDSKIGDKCLVFVKLDDTSKLKKGSYLLHSVGGISYIIKADEVNGNIISYTSRNGEDLTLDTTTEDYYGRVTFSSNFLGNTLSAFTSKENVSLTFILICGIFIISMLSLTIIYAIHIRNKRQADNCSPWYEERMELFDEDEDEEDADYVFGENSLITANTTDDHDENLIDLTDTPIEAAYPTNDISDDVEENLSIEEIKRVNSPPYYLLDNDIPSIDSLMNIIDTQFKGFNPEDKDIKIFGIKK